MLAGFVGLGKLGLPCALAAATEHDVVGYDVSPHAREILASKRYPHREERAQELLESTTLRVVGSVGEVVAHADLVFVAVQTPHQPEYEGVTRMPETRADFDYAALRGAVRSICDEAAAQEKRLTLVVISTVLPGTCAREIVPLLNRYVGFVYDPFFIAMGTTVNDFFHPEFVLLGVDRADEESVRRVMEFYSAFHAPDKFRFMSVESAELTKVAYNVYLGQKIVVANAVMEIAHKVGADCDDVTDALAMAKDRVVSPKYMRGGMGDGGACFIKGEKIYAEYGFVPIDQIQVGDKVMGGDGEYHEVLETYRRPYKGHVFTIKPKDSRLVPFTVTGEHPIHVEMQETAGQRGIRQEVRAADLERRFHKLVFTNGVVSEILNIGVDSYEGTVYNLNVADVHTYVCGGAIVNNCHPRDQIALSWLAQELDLSYDIFDAMVRAREAQTEWLAELCVRESQNASIVVLGKAYKRGTNLTVGSPAVLLANLLSERGAYFTQWDPHVDGPREFSEPAAFIVAADHDEFFQMKFPAGSVVVDPWGKVRDQEGVRVVRVGRGTKKELSGR